MNKNDLELAREIVARQFNLKGLGDFGTEVLDGLHDDSVPVRSAVEALRRAGNFDHVVFSDADRDAVATAILNDFERTHPRTFGGSVVSSGPWRDKADAALSAVQDIMKARK